MLFSKNITDITWQDIIAFCDQGTPEGATLDYKKDFPKNLQKSIAAFANTMGGVILIGIDEDEENKPKLPIDGIPFEKGISERIMNIILSNITPPVFPEIQVCLNEDKSKAIAVIRIPQSNNTPHAINNNTEVYVRTGNRTNSEPLATVDNLFWLAEHRSQSVVLHDKILDEAEKRFKTFYNLELGRAVKEGKFKYSPDICRLTFSLSPCYPKDYYCTPPELIDILNKIYVEDYYGTSEEFPIGESRFRTRLNQSGLNLGLFINNYAYYTELNCYGIFYYRQHLFGRLDKADIPPVKQIRMNEIISRLDQFLASANKFYEEIGFYGLLSLTFSIDGLNKFDLKIGIKGDEKKTFEESVSYELTFMKSQIIPHKKEIIFKAIRNLAWAYNWDIKMDYFKHFEKHFVAL